jgi:GNAT superfamily N-acetyltransferase
MPANQQQTASGGVSIRPVVESDTAVLLQLIRELAEFERLLDAAVATEADLRTALFGPRPCAEAILAECDGQSAGFALFFTSFSTFVGRPGIYLEDLFVRPAFRRRRIGKALFQHVARLAVERNCGRLEWSVLDWNELAIEFYRSLGAVALSDWTVFRLTDETLRSAVAM